MPRAGDPRQDLKGYQHEGEQEDRPGQPLKALILLCDLPPLDFIAIVVNGELVVAYGQQQIEAPRQFVVTEVDELPVGRFLRDAPNIRNDRGTFALCHYLPPVTRRNHRRQAHIIGSGIQPAR